MLGWPWSLAVKVLTFCSLPSNCPAALTRCM
jgi:hypothetical protein